MATLDAAALTTFRAQLQAQLQGQPPAGTVLRSPAQSAIAAIAQLQNDLASATSTIAAADLGPFALGGSCDYDCFIGICLKTLRWGTTIDFGNVRGPLQQAVAEVRQAADEWTGAFAPARGWLLDTLPQFSADFGQQAQLIQTTNAAIVAAGGQATPAQLAAVQGAFQAITAGLQTGQGAIQQAVAAVSQFSTALTNAQGGLSGLVGNLQSEIDQVVVAEQNGFARSLACGQGDASSQIAGAGVVLNGAAGAIRQSFGVIASDAAVSTAAAQLDGALGNVLDIYQDVAGQLATAQSFPAGAIQDLHLDVAAGEWAQLASYASQTIQ